MTLLVQCTTVFLDTILRMNLLSRLLHLMLMGMLCAQTARLASTASAYAADVIIFPYIEACLIT